MTTSTATNIVSLPTFIRSMLTWSEKTVGVTVITYIAGFIIQNLHLGFLGVVNLDGFRVRYILTGILFISFIGSIFLPIYGLIHVLRQNKAKSSLRTLWSFINYSLQVYGLLAMVILGLQYLSGTTSNFIVSGQSITKYQWTNFLAAAFVLYFSLALGILVLFFVYKYFQHWIDKKLDNPVNNQKEDPIQKYGEWLFLFFFGTIIASIYTLTVYPYIPQQIGGGSLLPVEVITSNAKFSQHVSEPLHDVYLVDRTSSGSLFMVVDKQTQAKQVLEVASSQIEFVIYK